MLVKYRAGHGKAGSHGWQCMVVKQSVKRLQRLASLTTWIRIVSSQMGWQRWSICSLIASRVFSHSISPHYVARGRQIAALGLPRENVRPLTVAAGNGQTDAVKLAVQSQVMAVRGGETECEKAQSLSLRSVLSLQNRSHGKAVQSQMAVHGGETECEKAQSLNIRSVLSLQNRSHGKAVQSQMAVHGDEIECENTLEAWHL